MAGEQHPEVPPRWRVVLSRWREPWANLSEGWFPRTDMTDDGLWPQPQLSDWPPAWISPGCLSPQKRKLNCNGELNQRVWTWKGIGSALLWFQNRSDTLGETEVLLTQYEACQAGKENPLGFQEQWGEKHYWGICIWSPWQLVAGRSPGGKPQEWATRGSLSAEPEKWLWTMYLPGSSSSAKSLNWYQ